jgi:hypothetical protein
MYKCRFRVVRLDLRCNKWELKQGYILASPVMVSASSCSVSPFGRVELIDNMDVIQRNKCRLGDLGDMPQVRMVINWHFFSPFQSNVVQNDGSHNDVDGVVEPHMEIFREREAALQHLINDLGHLNTELGTNKHETLISTLVGVPLQGIKNCFKQGEMGTGNGINYQYCTVTDTVHG